MHINNINQSSSKDDRFSSSGFIFAAIGSAVGLGNMWKFPYITGQYGGAAFFILFIACLVIVGLPVLLAELAIGRGGRGSASSSYYKLSGSKVWSGLGMISVIAPFIIMSFYAIVAGWTLHYAMLSFSGKLFSNSDFTGQFNGFMSGYYPIVWQIVVLLLVAFVVMKGVSGGIEKFNKVLIPGMLALLVIIMVRALTLPGAGSGVSFFLSPDFSKLNEESALVALGHAFFSLSLGMGTMITYGSYVKKSQSLGAGTLAIAGGDLLYALIAGLIIFPTTFAFGIDPGQGPGLVFIALPAAFSAMPFGAFFGGLFFLLLAIAALTSTVSLLEVPVAFTMDRFGWSRKSSVWIIILGCFILGVPAALSLGVLPELTIGGKVVFDWMDFFASNILLPLGGLIVTVFAGYFYKGVADEAGLTAGWFRIWLFLLRFVAPILVVFVFLHTSGLIKF
ncbi:sodium-dependent transporter [Paenibacillus crassostreae]|uniref:Transporter n=1 Tax=Paenibacillus crassostreae TaxID=1763538 RepID=A0A167B8W3_9BACL|nr:sodium-dependent transporter [Paenibacillus crassostreae]AOZ93070.1 sodium-dependent transporter [Paenibacillus crassostreae]OAB71841.1 Na+-dependent transporter of the SNF family protein [Paenibacillus crassostreae]